MGRGENEQVLQEELSLTDKLIENNAERNITTREVKRTFFFKENEEVEKGSLTLDEPLIVEERTSRKACIKPTNIKDIVFIELDSEKEGFMRSQDVLEALNSKYPKEALKEQALFYYLNDRGLKAKGNGKELYDFSRESHPDVYETKNFASKEEVHKLLEAGELDKERMIFINYWDHSFWAADTEKPLRKTLIRDYGSENYDIKKVEKEARKHPWVKRATVKDVPYYNREFHGDKQLILEILLDQKTWDKVLGPLIESEKEKNRRSKEKTGPDYLKKFPAIDRFETERKLLKDDFDFDEFEKEDEEHDSY